MNYDVFNGDADGLCALQQLRLAEPKESQLVTGVKRDIKLLAGVNAVAGDRVTVLDISFDKNREEVERLLGAGARIEYYDHHYAGEIPQNANLRVRIDPSSETCTSLIVDHELDGLHRAWAVVGAFGDNFFDSARRAAEPLQLSEPDLETYRELGTLLNYNGYGSSIEDLFFPPDELFGRIRPYREPLEFVGSEPAFQVLKEGYESDMRNAEALAAEAESAQTAVFRLPDAAWARRVSGVFGNRLARENPGRAHALLTPRPGGGYVVSVRAPLSTKQGADELCRQFATGGGRQAAAGINHLPEADMGLFIDQFRRQFGT